MDNGKIDSCVISSCLIRSLGGLKGSGSSVSKLEGFVLKGFYRSNGHASFCVVLKSAHNSLHPTRVAKELSARNELNGKAFIESLSLQNQTESTNSLLTYCPHRNDYNLNS